MGKGSMLTPDQRAAKRAIDALGKPPSISMRQSLADRENKGHNVMVAQRIRGLSILPEVVDRIKEGWPDSEVARWIHQEGKLKEVPVDLLRLEVRRYRTQVMSPTEVTARRLPQGVIEAAHMVRHATDELGELCREIEEHRGILDKARKVLGKMMDTTTSEPKDDKPEAASEVPHRVLEAAGLSQEEVRAYLTLCGDGIGSYVKLVEAHRRLAVSSAQIKALLHVDTGSDRAETSEVIEARVVEYTKRRFAGRKDAQEVLSDPESRRKVMGIFQRVLADPKLKDDLVRHTGNGTENDPEVI